MFKTRKVGGVMDRYPGSLHNHTQYSNIRLRDCIIRENELIDQAIKLGHNAVAITDHESVSSWIKVEKYYNKIKEANPDFKVIRGNEIYLVRDGLNAENYNSEVDRYFHFILLAKDLIGAKQIMEISTRAWKRSYMARGMRRVPTYYNDLLEVIGENPGHVIGSTACLGGALPTQILRGTEHSKLNIWIEWMKNVFGEHNFYLEMQPSRNKDQIKVNRELYKLANKHNIGYIITTDSHYLTAEDREVHKVYLKAQSGDREVDEFYATTYMMDTNEIEQYMSYSFEDMDIVRAAYKSIQDIIDSCEDFSLMKPLKIPELKWKTYDVGTVDWIEWTSKIPMLGTFRNSQYKADRYLTYAIIDGIKRHPDLQNQEAYNEINACLEDTWVSSNVNNARWSAYYLNLQNIIDLCWEAGSLVGPGRGSGVGFILLYVLDITQINPLKETTKCFRWRFLNPERVSVLDVDFDIEGGRRAQVLSKFREFYGEDRVANVATFGTEQTKSAILTAARGLGIDIDIAQYIASLIPADRGQLRTLSQCMYGDKENDWAPVKQFVYEMTENYPELWNVATKIEGLVCRSGIHAGGVIFVDEPFTESTGLMRAPDGTICTQFELHDSEACSLIKYDALSVEAMDKIHNCIDLLCSYGYAERKGSLRETYEDLIGIYKIERKDPKMWQMVWEHKIQSLFQMEKQSGIQGIATLKPTSVDDLAILNSTIRLMAQEKGGEMPTDKLARFKRNPNEWTKEMEKYGLGQEEKAILEPILSMSYGLCIAQEQFMELVQLPELGGFSLTWADKLRKSIAKKNPKEYDALTKEFYEVTKEKGIDQKFAHYVWDVLIAMSKGYGFNQSHTLAYSLIALQEMNLAYKYPTIFWECACLINDSGGNDVQEEVEVEDDDDDDDSPSKEKTKAVNYGKIATAIGKMKSEGVNIVAPDINESLYTFSPDVKNNTILYGMSGITRIGDSLIKEIISGRPYNSVEDFLNRVKVNKPQMVNLIKSGAFDKFGARETVMMNYIDSITDKKKILNLRNLQMLIDYNLIPEKFDFQKRVFNFNKYLKKFKLDAVYYGIDNIAFEFLDKNNWIDDLVAADTESGFKLSQKKWDKIYQNQMDYFRTFIKDNQKELLESVNKLQSTVWEKYYSGNISSWEMSSISCYIHEHELQNVDYDRYGLTRFGDVAREPEIERYIPIKGKQVPIFKLFRIAGTVLDRNKQKKTVTLLTTDGVVTVKIYGDVFNQYDKQISEKDSTGKKHVIRKSEFARGNKIIVIGVRDGDNEWRAKKYSRTPYHLVETIAEVGNDGSIVIDNRNDE